MPMQTSIHLQQQYKPLLQFQSLTQMMFRLTL
jgi:hypothetical protein